MSKKVLFGSIFFFFTGSLLLFTVRFENPTRLIKAAPTMSLSFGAIGALVSLFTRRILGVGRADRLFVNLTISLITFIFMLVLAECALRFCFRDVSTTAESSGYFDKSCYDTLRTNAWGFRERNFDLGKPEGI